MTEERKDFGILAEFKTPQAVFHACERVRDAGFTKWDAYTPFPVHGLDDAMGLKPCKLPWIVLVMALTGMTLAFFGQVWVSVIEYPFIVSGKPLLSWPAFVPVTFEVTILFSALGAVFGMLGMNKLPQYYHSLFNSKRFEYVTDDRFFIAIEVTDPLFNHEETKKFLMGECKAEITEMVEL